MLIQVNFTNAIWISASIDLDILDLSLLDYEYFIPESRRRMQELPLVEEEIKNFTCNSKVTRQMPNTEASQQYDESTEQMSFMMVMGTIYSLLLSLILANVLKKLLMTLFSLQVIIHMFMLTVPFPGNIVNVVKKIKPLISFNIMKQFSVWVEKLLTFDSLKQIEMQDLIIPTARGMGVKHMNCIVNFKHILILVVIYLAKVTFAIILRMIMNASGKCVERYRVIGAKIFFTEMFAIT